MNRTQYVDTLEGFSLGTVVGSHLQPTLDRDIPHGDLRLANPFEDFEATYPMKPCRIIQVTPEIAAADAAQRAERERQHRASVTWTPPVSAPRAEPKPQLVLQQPRPDQRERTAAAARRNGALRSQPASQAEIIPAPGVKRKTLRITESQVNRDERTWFEEAELDALWNSLSVSDKWALLEEAI
jgi:hypothetical protein